MRVEEIFINKDNTMIFMTRSIWLDFEISASRREKNIKLLFGEKRVIKDREKAIDCLHEVLNKLNEKMLQRISNEDTYDLLFRLLAVFSRVFEYYLAEKQAREEIVNLNIRNDELLETMIANRNISRSIIDACNIWIENCVLLQSNLRNQGPGFRDYSIIDKDLFLDMFFYGIASQGLSFLALSEDLNQNTYYGIEVDPKSEIPIIVLKNHPIIYYNPAIGGNQAVLQDNNTSSILEKIQTVAEGFEKEHKIPFQNYLGVLNYYREIEMRGDWGAMIALRKKDLIECVNTLQPRVDGEKFLECAVISKEKLNKQLREGEKIIWKIGTNKYRLEIRPIIELVDGNVIIASAACKQSMQHWYSYCMNGGSCYSTEGIRDCLHNAIEVKNKQLSDLLLERIREILNSRYTARIDLVNVNYKRIFGTKEIDYGDYDIVFYTEETKELYLIESKYFSDSLNVSGIVNDYKKLFFPGGYYDHCRARYDMVIENPEKMKNFLGVDTKQNIKAHMLFVSSKPIEMELQDKDRVVTFLSLNTLDAFIMGKFISENGTYTVRPEIIL